MHPIVGIIGGMGPEATVDLMRRVIAMTPALDDQDHIHLIVDSNPQIPSRLAHLIDGTGEDPTPELVRIALALQQAGASVLAMPCNTAHAYLAAIRAAIDIPFLDMVARTVERIAEAKPRRVGLLASSAVHKIGLFAQAFAAHGIQTVIPQRQDDIMAIIKAVKRGDTGGRPQELLGDVALELSAQADVLLIACSELSVIASGIEVGFIDSIDVLANAIVEFAGSAGSLSHR